MKIAFIGDIVGKPGRLAVKRYLPKLRDRYKIDLVIANYENASHGFGLTKKNADELLGYGIDLLSGGNHSFDKKEIVSLFESYPIIRPLNYPDAAPGKGIYRGEITGVPFALINLLGHFAMPPVDNPFVKVREAVVQLKSEGIRHIVVDMHAEASAEKQALMHLLKSDVSAIMGTHTHVPTDDLSIVEGCCYVTDVGLTGCRDGIIGMKSKEPLDRFLTGIGAHYDIPDKCKTVFRAVLFELDAKGRCVDAQRVTIYNGHPEIVTPAWIE